MLNYSDLSYSAEIRGERLRRHMPNRITRIFFGGYVNEDVYAPPPPNYRLKYVYTFWTSNIFIVPAFIGLYLNLEAHGKFFPPTYSIIYNRV